jgi:repressor LexA
VNSQDLVAEKGNAVINAAPEMMTSNRVHEQRPVGRGSAAQERNGMLVAAKKPTLTKRQREIYEFLRDKIINRGYGPTVREIGLHFDIRSPNGVMCHLKALERKGLISREQNMSRAIQLSDSPQNRLSVSLIGSAVAGGPIQPSVSSDEVITFNTVFEGSDIACLKVEGNVFAALHIMSGDYIIINREMALQPGCHVAALDDRHAVIICTVQDGSNQLIPAIPGPFTSTTRQVLGVITGVVRKFRLPAAATADAGITK